MLKSNQNTDNEKKRAVTFDTIEKRCLKIGLENLSLNFLTAIIP